MSTFYPIGANDQKVEPPKLKSSQACSNLTKLFGQAIKENNEQKSQVLMPYREVSHSGRLSTEAYFFREFSPLR